jgi:DNA (cytosine-5)-methyltransferase 1
VAKRRRTFLSLFSGCGGLDFGFHASDFRCLGAFDSDPVAIATYQKNFGADHATCLDLRHWRTLERLPRPDLIVAGPPCQGFSTVGPFDADDPRNDLLLVPVRLAARLKPTAIVIENVPGVALSHHASVWRRAQRELARAGYNVSVQAIDVADFGVSQLRRRVIITASLSGAPTLQALGPSPRTLEKILEINKPLASHLPKPLPKGSRGWHIAKVIHQGQKLCNVRRGSSAIHTWDVPEVFGRVTSDERQLLNSLITLRRRHRVRKRGDADPVPLHILHREFGPSAALVRALLRKGYVWQPSQTTVDLRHTFNGKFRRLSGGGLSHAVLTQFCDPSHFLHPFEHRPFTPREAARIQSFPDDFQFLGSAGQQARLIGNAVPPNVSVALAEWARLAV